MENPEEIVADISIVDEDKTTLDRDIQRAERLLKRAERDMMICNLYLSGESVKEIGKLANLSRQRVYQIVRGAGVQKPETAHLNREELVGVVMSEDDKRALRAEAEKKGVSMSKWTLDLIKEKLNDIKIRERLVSMSSRPKCDGNHGGPACVDPECWQREE